MKESPNDVKFIYVTPYLSEVQRIKESCPEKDFKEPFCTDSKTKKQIFMNLIKSKQNIVTTHVLFQNLGKTEIELEELKDYILVLDETINVIETRDISQNDLDAILNSDKPLMEVEKETGKVIWKIPDPHSRYTDLQEMANMGILYYYGTTLFVWTFPTELFTIFRKTFILTYMFAGQMQKGYYDIYNIEYKYIHIKHNIKINDKLPLENYGFEDEVFTEPYKYDTSCYKKLINICTNEKLNRIGESLPRMSPLSSSWYARAVENGNIEIVRKNLLNYFVHIANSTKHDFMWTTFSDYIELVEDKKKYKTKLEKTGNSKKPVINSKSAFISCNMRASNEFMHKKDLAYLINIFYNPIIKNFFVSRGGKVDEDTYALSELIQWIFRSAIRNFEPINLYIPSERMRTLLEQWMEPQQE